MKTKATSMFKWIMHYIFAGAISVSALLIAKSYLKTNYDLLISDVDRNDYKTIVTFLETEQVPYIVSFDYKRIRVPDYEIPRLQNRMKSMLGIKFSELDARGGY